MNEILVGKVQAGFGDAARWLKLFNAAYSEKLGMLVFPGSLNDLRNISAYKIGMWSRSGCPGVASTDEYGYEILNPRRPSRQK